MRMQKLFIRWTAFMLAVTVLLIVTPFPCGVMKAEAAEQYLDGLLAEYANKIHDGFANKGNYVRPSAREVLKDYEASSQYQQHPRLMITKDVIDNQLKPATKNPDDPRYDLYQKIKARADNVCAWLKQAPEKHLPSYKKMFEDRMPGPSGAGKNVKASDDFRYKMMVLGICYQLTDNETEKQAYAEAAWTILKRITNYYESDEDSYDNFKDINPWHNLDFGTFSQGLAIGYDWLYQAWTPEQKERLQEAIVRLCFRVANDSYSPDSPGNDVNLKYQEQTYKNGTLKGVLYNHNHNSFVNSGIVMAALAFMDEYPEITSSLCSDAFISLERNLNAYDPSGLSNESPQYWLFTMDNLSMLFSSLETALEIGQKTGSLYGLDTCPGMAGGKPMKAIQALESDAGTFTFGDTDEGKVTTAGELYFYKHYHLKGLRTTIFQQVKSVNDDYARLTQALCWHEPQEDDLSALSRDWSSSGDSAFATFRDHFGSNQTFVGIKAGKTIKDNFVHLDQGSFVFHSQGVKWLTDLGKEKYTVWGYTSRNDERWNIFRLRPDGHNVLLIGPNPNDYGYALGRETTLETECSDGQAKAVVDLTKLVGAKAAKARRGFLFTDDRKTLVVRDEVTLKKTTDVYWVAYTKQSVSRNGNVITLTASGGKTLTLDFISDQPGEFVDSMDGVAYNAAPWDLAPQVKTDSTHPPQNSNDDYKRIVYKVSNATGDLKITVKLTPGNVDKNSVPAVTEYGDVDTWDVKKDPLKMTFLHNCEFNNNIAMHYAIPKSELAGCTNVRLVIDAEKYAEGATTPTWKQYVVSDYSDCVISNVEYCHFTFPGISAAEMGNVLKAKIVFEKDGETLESKTDAYSVKDYAYNRLEYSGSATYKTLMVDVLNYGAAAQVHFGRNAAHPVNADLTDEQKAYGSSMEGLTVESVESVIPLKNGTVMAAIDGKNVSFDNKVVLIYRMDFSKFTKNLPVGVTEEKKMANVKIVFTYDGKKSLTIPASQFQKDDGKYLAYCDALAPAQMGCTVNATIYDGDQPISDTFQYSIESYVNDRLTNSTSATFKDLIQKMVLYGRAAKSHFK